MNSSPFSSRSLFKGDYGLGWYLLPPHWFLSPTLLLCGMAGRILDRCALCCIWFLRLQPLGWILPLQILTYVNKLTMFSLVSFILSFSNRVVFFERFKLGAWAMCYDLQAIFFLGKHELGFRSFEPQSWAWSFNIWNLKLELCALGFELLLDILSPP